MSLSEYFKSIQELQIQLRLLMFSYATFFLRFQFQDPYIFIDFKERQRYITMCKEGHVNSEGKIE